MRVEEGGGKGRWRRGGKIVVVAMLCVHVSCVCMCVFMPFTVRPSYNLSLEPPRVRVCVCLAQCNCQQQLLSPRLFANLFEVRSCCCCCNCCVCRKVQLGAHFMVGKGLACYISVVFII